ncbi:MAG: HD domain-containing protein [Clostridia bacterium]|nr:HD domain-containing protein [Clostridia bacterium]
MKQTEFIKFLNVIEKLKCNTRHSWTSTGRRESVAEHSWRLAIMAMLCRDEYPSLDIDKVIKMCLIHDLGEAITGDIPSFYKTESHENEEEKAIDKIISMLPAPYNSEFESLFAEMEEKATDEGRCTIVINRLKIDIFAQYCIKNPRYTLVLSRISSLSCDKTI